MKRRVFALLAVPAVALGFAFSSAGTEDAQAYNYGIECTIGAGFYARAVSYGDDASAEYIYDTSMRAGCDPWQFL